ncbi:DUF397 domain-containing protein [Spirillospora sp. NPDC127200]
MSKVPWRKSSYSSGSSNTDCVELAALGARVGVRDSKAPGAGHLSLSSEGFAVLVGRLKRGELTFRL